MLDFQATIFFNSEAIREIPLILSYNLIQLVFYFILLRWRGTGEGGLQVI